MKAVILAAGKSTRLHPLTVNRPKVLMPVANVALLEHNLRQLLETKLIDEAVIVVGFQSEQVMTKLGNKYGKIRLAYAFQIEQLGTGHALLQAEKHIGGEKKFLVLMGDDLYSSADLKKCLKHNNCTLAKKVQNISSFGKVVSEKGVLKRIIEKPDDNGPGLSNTGCYALSHEIFKILKSVKKSNRGEIELTDAIQQLPNVAVEKAEFWQPITYPWSLLDANEALLKQHEKEKLKIAAGATLEKGATLKGYVSVGKGTIVRSGAYIEGPVVIGDDCVIGPNCYIRPYTSIGNKCKVGNAVEIKNSILMDHAVIGHLSYCGDSVIGWGVNFGAGTITANLRHDDGHVKSTVKGDLISSGRRKLGTIIGDNAKTGIHTSIYPGRKIWPGKTTSPGEIVKKDVQ